MYFVSLILILTIVSRFGVKCREVLIQSRIIGGSYCALRFPDVNYKFMISLRTYDEDFDFYEHFCGGTLLTEYWVLTAGHCSKPKTMYAVEAYRIDEIEYNGPVTKILSRKVHPKFDNETNNNDIALLQLSSPIFKSDKVGFVSIPLCKIPVVDLSEKLIANKCSTITVMGWGQTTKDDQGKWFPVQLECLDLNVMKLSECREAHEHHQRNKIIHDQNICTKASNSFDFWRGDSGGPLLCGDVQYGVISWGYGAQGYPSVYTRVDEYLDFIRKIVCRAPGA